MRHVRAFFLLMLMISTSGKAAEQAKPWLGVAIEAGKAGVLIKQTLKDTPAEKAGFTAGDEILAADDKAVAKPEDLIREIQTKGVGHKVKVRYSRQGVVKETVVELVARPDTLALLQKERVGRKAPTFDLPVVHGKGSGKLADHGGKVVVLEVWATWCPACLSTHDRLSQVAREWETRGLSVLAISDEDEDALKAFAKQTKPSFTILRDASGAMQKDWYVPAIPMLAVIDREGVVRHATIGAGRYLEETLAVAENLLSAKPGK